MLAGAHGLPTVAAGILLSDKDREDLIEAYRLMLVLEPERHMKEIAMLRMGALIRERSPARVCEMEMRMGLHS